MSRFAPILFLLVAGCSAADATCDDGSAPVCIDIAAMGETCSCPNDPCPGGGVRVCDARGEGCHCPVAKSP